MFASFALSFLIRNWRTVAIVGGLLAIAAFGALERIRGYEQGKSDVT